MPRIRVNTPISLLPKMPNENIKIGVLPLNIKWADKEYNLKAAHNAIRSCDDVNVVVLPELFTTGFSPDIDVLNEVTEGNDGITITSLKELSTQRDILISGSFLAKDGAGNLYNRGFMITPGDNVVFYDKHHLFGPSAESRLFKAGTGVLPVVDFKGWKLSMMVCYDLRFPVWCRRGDCNCQYDIMLVPANWPISRSYAWEHLLIARAIENQAIVVGADRSGQDDYGDYEGLTRFYDATGHPVDYRQDGALQVAEFSYTALTDFRRRWPVANDADVFCLKY